MDIRPPRFRHEAQQLPGRPVLIIVVAVVLLLVILYVTTLRENDGDGQGGIATETVNPGAPGPLVRSWGETGDEVDDGGWVGGPRCTDGGKYVLLTESPDYRGVICDTGEGNHELVLAVRDAGKTIGPLPATVLDAVTDSRYKGRALRWKAGDGDIEYQVSPRGLTICDHGQWAAEQTTTYFSMIGEPGDEVAPGK